MTSQINSKITNIYLEIAGLESLFSALEEGKDVNFNQVYSGIARVFTEITEVLEEIKEEL